jgi:hypothetical protein
MDMMDIELEPGIVVGPWRLVERIEGTRPTKWTVSCVGCEQAGRARVDRRLEAHLKMGIPPGCGKCKTKGGGVSYAGVDAKKKVAARAGVTISDEEAWAFEHCDYDKRAQKIVDKIIRRETAILRKKKQAEFASRLRPDDSERDIPQYSPVEERDGTD